MSKNLVLLVAAAALINPARGATIAVTNSLNLGQTAPGVGGTAPALATAANGVHALGITFGFTRNGISSNDAMYGSNMLTTANMLAPLIDPVLDGPADGILTLTFDAPSTFLSFDIVFGWMEDVEVQVKVEGLSQAVTETFTTTGGSGDSFVFSIGSFSWTPASPFTKAVIMFDSSVAERDFAIDNLSYDLALAASPVPEPGSLISFGSGALLLGLAAGLRQFRASGISR